MAVRPVVSSSVQLPRMRRRMRAPEHNFFVKFPPFCLQPVAVAPVLAGETLKKASVKYRAVSDTVLSPLVGWHLEHYLYYVPGSVLDNEMGGGFKSMLLDLESPVGTNETRSDVYYMKDDAASQDACNFLRYAMVAIVNRYFRTEADVENPATYYFGAGGPPGDGRWFKVRAQPPGWMDSLRPATDETGIDITILDAASTDTLQVSEVEDAMRRWEILRMQGLTNQTWEEYLRTYNVKVPEDPAHPEPEELRYVRQWQLPTNTVEPTTGAVKTALFWGNGEFSVDKDRFFREPGFLVMCVCARPKTYFAKQTSFAASQMVDGLKWLPATLWNDAKVGLRRLPVDTLVKDLGGEAQMDVRDLFMYGDQFTNDLAGTDHNLVPLPVTDNRLYIPDADIKALFSDITKYFVREDGRIDFQIASSISDPEPVLSGS